jgi:hypothetical protein
VKKQIKNRRWEKIKDKKIRRWAMGYRLWEKIKEKKWLWAIGDRKK